MAGTKLRGTSGRPNFLRDSEMIGDRGNWAVVGRQKIRELDQLVDWASVNAIDRARCSLATCSEPNVHRQPSFAICPATYVVAFLVNHALAPRFEQVNLDAA